jgi:hypothetical protein
MQCALQFYPKYLLNFVSLTYKKITFHTGLIEFKTQRLFQHRLENGFWA